jgi:hypothetical protein
MYTTQSVLTTWPDTVPCIPHMRLGEDEFLAKRAFEQTVPVNTKSDNIYTGNESCLSLQVQVQNDFFFRLCSSSSECVQLMNCVCEARLDCL